MRRTLLGLLVLYAVMLGVGAAGTPVNGDSSVAATTAGINLGHSVHHPPRAQVAPLPSLLESRLLRFLVLLVASAVAITRVGLDEHGRSVVWAERRPQRGPPFALDV